MTTRARVRLSVGIVVAISILVLTPDDARTVTAPMVFGLLAGVCFFTVLADRSQVAPVAEIGTWFVGAAMAYMIVPLAIYLVLGQQYTPINDNRLWVINPSPADVARIGWLYFAFLASFAVAYLAIRGRAEPIRARMGVTTSQTMGVMVSVWVVLQVVRFVFVPDMSSAGGYGGGYVAVNALPLGIRQVLKISEGWVFILTLGLRAWLFKNYSRTKWLIVAWLAYDTTIAFVAPGARTVYALSMGATFMLYHFYVRAIAARTAAAVSVVALLTFLVLGFVRSAQNMGSLTIGPMGGEFESLFGNAIDLQSRVSAGEVGQLPISLHLADLFAAFPSQVLPFVKQDPAVWYLGFYPEYAEQGGGFAFGAIAQGIIGFGWMELVVRGCAVGVAFGLAHRYFVRNVQRFWVVIFYVWSTVWAYQSLRNQSFVLIAYTVQGFLPLMVVIEGLRVLFRRVSAKPDHHSSPGSFWGTEARS